jgi:hypothetical protein
MTGYDDIIITYYNSKAHILMSMGLWDYGNITTILLIISNRDDYNGNIMLDNYNKRNNLGNVV